MTILFFLVFLCFGTSCNQSTLWLLTAYAVKQWLLGMEICPCFDHPGNRELNCKCHHEWLDLVPLLDLQTLMHFLYYYYYLKIEGFKEGFI